MIRKLKNSKGESLIETLAALIVITLTFVFMVNSIVKSGELKNKADKADANQFEYAASSTFSVEVTIIPENGDPQSGTAAGYACENPNNSNYSYYYYKTEP